MVKQQILHDTFKPKKKKVKQNTKSKIIQNLNNNGLINQQE